MKLLIVIVMFFEYEKEIKEKYDLPNVRIAESPEYANAKGLYK